MIASANNPLLSYLASQGMYTPQTGATVPGVQTNAGKTNGSSKDEVKISAEAMDRAARMHKAATAAQAIQKSQEALSADLRKAMEKAGIALSEEVQITVSAKGAVEVAGSDEDKAAIKEFLKTDTSVPSFAQRIAEQAEQAMQLSHLIQQSAAIMHAAMQAKTSGSVVALYSALMQQAQVTANVVYTLSAQSSSLTYPGSLAAQA